MEFQSWGLSRPYVALVLVRDVAGTGGGCASVLFKAYSWRSLRARATAATKYNADNLLFFTRELRRLRAPLRDKAKKARLCVGQYNK